MGTGAYAAGKAGIGSLRTRRRTQCSACLCCAGLRWHGCKRCLTPGARETLASRADRKSTRLNSSHTVISYAVFCLKKKITETQDELKEVSFVRRAVTAY